MAHDVRETGHRHEHPSRGYVDELAPEREGRRRISSHARHVEDVHDEEREADQSTTITGAPQGEGTDSEKGDHDRMREYPAADVDQAQPQVSNAATRHLRVVSIGR